MRFERCREPFAAWADLIVRVGPVGAGTRAKPARNLLTFVSFTAVAKAQRLAEAAGISLVSLARVVRHSDAVTGGPGAIMLRDATRPLDPGDDLYPILEHGRELGEKDLSVRRTCRWPLSSRRNSRSTPPWPGCPANGSRPDSASQSMKYYMI